MLKIPLKIQDHMRMTSRSYSIIHCKQLGVVHKGRPQRGGRGVYSDADKCGQGKGGFDSMRTSASQLGTKACHAGMCSCSVPERQDRN